MATQVRVFDPAMCCSTGVCGPSVDPDLARFSADLEWLKSRDVSVERFNLAQQPAAFVEHVSVRQALEANGEAALPLIMVNGAVKSAGTYPTREQLAEWAGATGPGPSMFTEAVTESAATDTGATSTGGCCTRQAMPLEIKKSKCC